MGNSKYEVPSDNLKKKAVVQIPNLKKKKGIIIITDNKFFKRLWFFVSNPFRYIFTGKIRF